MYWNIQLYICVKCASIRKHFFRSQFIGTEQNCVNSITATTFKLPFVFSSTFFIKMEPKITVFNI